LSEATPSHIGRAYLRKLYKVIHPEGWEEDDLAYFEWANLADDLLEDLLWWRHTLINDSRRCCRLHKAGTFHPPLAMVAVQAQAVQSDTTRKS
jgi:hypothetical protein